MIFFFSKITSQRAPKIKFYFGTAQKQKLFSHFLVANWLIYSSFAQIVLFFFFSTNWQIFQRDINIAYLLLRKCRLCYYTNDDSTRNGSGSLTQIKMLRSSFNCGINSSTSDDNKFTAWCDTVNFDRFVQPNRVSISRRFIVTEPSTIFDGKKKQNPKHNAFNDIQRIQTEWPRIH